VFLFPTRRHLKKTLGTYKLETLTSPRKTRQGFNRFDFTFLLGDIRALFGSALYWRSNTQEHKYKRPVRASRGVNAFLFIWKHSLLILNINAFAGECSFLEQDSVLPSATDFSLNQYPIIPRLDVDFWIQRSFQSDSVFLHWCKTMMRAAALKQLLGKGLFSFKGWGWETYRTQFQNWTQRTSEKYPVIQY